MCPLPGALEESVFERWLKRAGLGLADPKPGTDFKLRGAAGFHIVSASLVERCAQSIQSQRRRVAIAAEMPEHNALDSSW